MNSTLSNSTLLKTTTSALPILSGSITIQTKSDSLVPGATYNITPNPATGNGTLVVADGGQGDQDRSDNGEIKLSQVPFGTYSITQTVTPSGFISLIKSTTVTVIPALDSPTVAFQVSSSSADLSQLSPTSITAPSLTPAALNTLITSLSAKIVSGNLSSALNNVNQLPQIIVAGNSNATAVNAAINSQSSLLVNASFASLAGGQTIVSTINLPNYTLPNSTSVAAIIPAAVTTVNAESGQVIATPPIDKIIPGQKMIIPVSDSLVPGFGGLKEIDLQSSPQANSTGGTAPVEWLVAQVDNKLPSSIPSDGIADPVFLFVSIQYPFDQTGVGFNWGNPANHAVPPVLTIVVNKTSSVFIQNDTSGCPVIDAYTLSAGSWISNGLGEISSQSLGSNQCEIKIQTPHYSKFAFSMRHIGSIKEDAPGQFGVGTVVPDDTNPVVISDSSVQTANTVSAVSGIQTANAISAVSDTSTTTSTQTQSSETLASTDDTAQYVQGFSHIQCSKESGYVLMTGQFTSTDTSYKVIFVQMNLLDSTGNVVATGNGVITDVGIHEIRSFDALARTNSDFATCTVQVDSLIPQ